jgi:uncharacterized protein YfiM (DUF2279 family)
MKKKLSIIFVVLFLTRVGISQVDTNFIFRKTLNYSAKSLIYLGFTYEMSQQFFSSPHTSKFHLRQDWQTWRGLDKFFHSYGSYQMTSMFYQLNKWSGIPKNRALNLAFLESTLFSTTKEYCDGRVDVGGWSWYDIGMNLSGNSLFYFQEKIFKKQIIQFKYSYTNSGLQHYNPSTLGTSWKNYWLKDYNGETFWLSTSLGNLNLTHNKWLKPIAFCLGYGANNLIYEFDNKTINLNRYSQFYLGLDIDLTQIETKNKFLKTTFFLLNRFRIPLPSVEFSSEGKISFHPLFIK